VYSARPALVVAAAVILCGTGGSALAQTAGTLTVIANVKDPSGGVIRGSDGAMYGTSVTGPGTSNCGYVYRLARSGGTFGLQILHEFMGAPSGGCQPNGELVLGLDGALYGTTRYGGANTHGYIGQPVGTGTIYRVVTSGVHSVTVLHSFAGVDGSGLYVEGIWPVVGLAMGPDGTFYGVNAVGGTGSFSPGPGTLFRYSQAGGLDVLHNFFVSPATDQDPNDALTFGSDGSLYWTDTLNSALRRLTPGSGPSSPSTVFTFPNTGCSNSAACDPLGKNPYARPTEVSGQLYVLSKDFGAPPGGYGALVRVDQNGAGHLVHGFSGGPDGGHPQVALTRGSDGFLYGVTGGANQTGPTIFRVAPDGTGFQTLHEFVLSGPGPRAPLFEFAPGELIGTSGSAGGYIFHLSLLPALSSLSPWSATVGGAGFALTVNGTRFVSGSQVRWNGSPRPTTFINGGQLQATISASDLATGGTASVTVTNPGPITGPSNALPFVIAPTMALDKTTLHFGAVKSGASLLSQTSAQIVRLTQSGAGTVTWTASSNQPWLQVTPASGSGSANLSISVSAAGTPASGSVSGSISL
jgi:uncharacterized repeat protein (TIGR03803 family)